MKNEQPSGAKRESWFYCKIHSGSMADIDEWNEVRESLEVTNLTEKEKQKILFPPVCSAQCFDCMAEVGETRMKTQRLIEKIQNGKT